MTDKPKRQKMISVRASEEEIARVKTLAHELIKTNKYLKEADVLRELLSLIDTGLITKEMRRRLSHPDGIDEEKSDVIIAEGSERPFTKEEKEGYQSQESLKKNHL
jgi:hypothetical protein